MTASWARKSRSGSRTFGSRAWRQPPIASVGSNTNGARGAAHGFDMFVINCKNYAEATGARLARLVRAADAASARYGAEIAVAPPVHAISSVRARRVAVFAQHVDDCDPGSTTGHLAPELLRASGVSGAIINHSEHRVPFVQIRYTIRRLRSLGMASIVCSRTVAETAKVAALGPDYVAIEPPSLIGTGTAISRARPRLVTAAADAVRGKSARLLCGAGIVSGDDVSKAVELGAGGILVASGIVKSPSPSRTISEFASRLGAKRGRPRR